MQHKYLNGLYTIRIKRGEELIQSLRDFISDKKIPGGFFWGIGAVDKVELAHYNVDKKKYATKMFNNALEMTNVSGNIGWFENEFIIHAHGTFSDVHMKVIAGHLVEARVSGTAEILFVKTSKLTKIFDKVTGLKLFNL